MPHVERLSVQERLHLARRRRLQQLRAWAQREKEWNKRQVRNLLQKGVDPDATNEDGLTALHQEMLLLLLEHGANVNAEDSERWTPLHAAATCGHLHLVRVLVSRAANLLAVNADGNMPYDICEDESALDYIEAEMARRGVTQELIDETRASTELQMLHELQEVAARGGDLELKDAVHGATPLHIASANGYLRVVDFLLDQHVSTDPKDKDAWQPVHAAACWGHTYARTLSSASGSCSCAVSRRASVRRRQGDEACAARSPTTRARRA
ncbi:hypothetical protein B566_EDAN016377 [Ephemera danica]|nr:hypothetical protein B566_EDAN016377 [Ephemera danica]